MNEVISFYDEHPINEGEILSKLEQEGKDLAHLVPEDLQAHDQDHYGGIEATDILANRLALKPGMRVLDICSGMGGTSRYLAWRHGCEVVGVDLTASRVRGAEKLTAMVGLNGQVSYVHGDACALELPGESFDAAISQESFLHIPDKAALMVSCHRALKPGGRLAFTDWVAFPGLTAAMRERLRDGIAANDIATAEEYSIHLRSAGFTNRVWEDISDWWEEILGARLEMYRSLEAETVSAFGEARHKAYIEAYTFFVGLVHNRCLGGGRFHAVKE
jgi:ubiquinone/menaquinone biosynthesis C-methylase UbiE